MQVRDARTWAVLRTLTVAGTLAAPMACDSLRHRGFVVVNGCRVHAAGDLAWLPGWLRRRLAWLATTPSVQADRTCILVVDTTR